MWDWFYDMPTIWSFFLFVIIVTTVALVGLYIFKSLNISVINCEDNNSIIGIFIGIISIFLGVMLTLIIVGVWNDYDRARSDANREATNIFILYQTISKLPDTEDIQDIIIEYLEYIINVEYPALRHKEVPHEGTIFIEELQDTIYGYIPEGEQQIVLYAESIQTLNRIIHYRIDRLDSATVGINDLIWWVTMVDSILLLIMSWFLTCSTISHYILTTIVAIYVASAIYITLIMSFPFRGYAGLRSQPFQIALDDILSE